MTRTSWETLQVTPSVDSVYLRCLKLSITLGSFVMYKSKAEGSNEAILQVGRVLEVMKSINQVPECRRSPAILCGQQDEAAAIVDDDDSHDTTIPPQFIRINIFKSRDSFAEEDFAVGDDYDSGWNYLIQMEEDDWILADSIINLSFVFPEEEVRAHQHDDCRGMFNFFVLKHRRSQSGFVSLIPRLACPPFGVQLDGFDKFWSVDNCHMIFNSIRQIARGLQRLLCRIAQSQGDFSSRNIKIHVPSCCWVYIKYQFVAKGVVSTCRVAFSEPKSILGWGLAYYCIRANGHLEALRFDTKTKMKAFRDVFGCASGYGVRKKRPRYQEGKSLLNMNDVINVVCCYDEEGSPQQQENSGVPFQRFSVMEDGIDLLYNEHEGILQLVVRYCRVVVTNDSIQSLASIGVGTCTSMVYGSDITTSTTTTGAITPGMDFMDGDYLMRVTSVRANVVNAQRKYKVVGNRSIAIDSCDCDNNIEYTDVFDVRNRIQAMLE